MALVKVLTANLFAGSSLQLLGVGEVYDVSDALAEKWIKTGKAEKSSASKGEALADSVSAGVDSTGLSAQLNEALEQLKQAHEEVELKDKIYTDAMEQLKQAHDTALTAEKERADTAEAALAAATKKGK